MTTIKWMVSDESKHYVRLTAHHLVLRLQDLDEIEDIGLKIVSEYHGEEKHVISENVFANIARENPPEWGTIRILCRKNNPGLIFGVGSVI